MKTKVGLFGDPKIMAILGQRHGETYFVVWFLLKDIAGTVNCDGYTCLSEQVPLTGEYIARVLRRRRDVVEKALDFLEQIDLISRDEEGRKKDIGKDWYFEPQVQLQYAHVSDADYTTSQGTSVELDAIDSLLGRVGFRLGKDMGENNTFYVKANVLHEFLGDQDISAFDDTGRLDTTYENEGTWYDVGLGFSHQFSKGTYMFFDVEKTFGNDNEDTYQFNVGMNWKV